MRFCHAIQALSTASQFSRGENSRAQWLTLHNRVETMDMQPECDTQIFRYETELRDPCVSWLESRFAGCTVVDECDVSHLAPDLVIGTNSDFRLRAQQGFPAITNWSQLALARSVWHSKGHRVGGAALRSTGRSVRPLIDNGVMREINGELEVSEIPKCPFSQIVAVELKMKDWRKAISQASRYQSFADLSYIALPYGVVQGNVLDAATMLGVGVLALIPGECELLVEAKRSRIIDPALASLASELAFSAATGQKQFLRAAGSRRGIVNEPVLVG